MCRKCLRCVCRRHSIHIWLVKFISRDFCALPITGRPLETEIVRPKSTAKKMNMSENEREKNHHFVPLFLLGERASYVERETGHRASTVHTSNVIRRSKIVVMTQKFVNICISFFVVLGLECATCAAASFMPTLPFNVKRDERTRRAHRFVLVIRFVRIWLETDTKKKHALNNTDSG